VNVSTAVGYDPAVAGVDSDPSFRPWLGLRPRRGIRLATNVRTAFPLFVESRVGSRCDMRELKTLALRTVVVMLRALAPPLVKRLHALRLRDVRTPTLPWDVPGRPAACPDRADRATGQIRSTRCNRRERVVDGAGPAARARTLLLGLSSWRLRPAASATAGREDSLVPRSSPFARAVGERRMLGPSTAGP
jgi:hypothetical protein